MEFCIISSIISLTVAMYCYLQKNTADSALYLLILYCQKNGLNKPTCNDFKECVEMDKKGELSKW